jgi:class 3 adenylate cyclase/tetratricopeptide (TPR) repeat protein
VASPSVAFSEGQLRYYVPQLLVDRGAAAFASGFLEVEGTLLSADLSGFTKLSERLARIGKEGAEELTEVLNDCFDRMIAVVRREGGDILKFGGDALLILYTGAAHTTRSCRSALAMRTLIAEPVVAPSGARVKLRISQGMHAGRFGLFAVTGGHTELLVTGPGATETVRCEGEADAGEILLSAAAAALVEPRWLGKDKAGGRLLRRVAIADDISLDLSTDEQPAAAGVEQFVPAAQREVIALGAPSEHRRVTVAFLKFSHTDALYETDGPAALRGRLAQLAEVVGAVCETHGVHWLGSDVYPDGGKLILTAGAPVSFGRDEERMLRALRDILDAGIDLDLRVGVNYGPVFVGNLGSAQRRTFTVMGDAVNLAARLMQKAEPGQLVASDALLQRVRAPCSTVALEPFFVKGKAAPIDAAVVMGIASAQAPGVRSSLPLVGRDRELAHLQALVADARERRGRVMEIVGGSGTGKSRLVEELRDREPDVRAIAVICGQYARSTPYFALRILLRGLAGVDTLAAPDEAGALLTQWVTTTAPELLRWLPLIADAFEAEVPSTPDAERIAPEYRRDRTHEAIALLLTAACQDATIFIIEDAHFLDDASREFLAEMAAHPSDRPWVLIVTRRPGAQVFEADVDERRSRIDLEPHDGRAAFELAVLAAGDETKFLPGEWEAVTERAAGNPLFVIELASTTARGAAGDLPESVEGLVTARIDTLAAEDRLLLREAAVLGMIIDLDLCGASLGMDEATEPSRWETLDEFVEAFAPGRLQFRHRLHQQVAYEGLSYRRRRDVHRRVGDALARRAGEHPERNAELLSTHYFYAAAHDLGWRFSVIAGDRACDKYANVEAAEFYRRALECARRVDEIPTGDLARVTESLGDVSEVSGRYEDAASCYGRARRLVRDARDDTVRLLRKEGVVRERMGQYRDALRWYSRGLREVEDATDADAASARAQLSLAYAAVRHRQGRYSQSVSWAERAVGDAEFSNDRAALARAYFVLDIGHTYLGNPERMEYRGRALPIYEELGDDAGLSIVLNNLGLEAQIECDWDAALTFYRRSREACERIGDVVGAATAVNNEAEILLDQGYVDDAAERLRSALHVWRSARYPIGVAIASANLGLAEVRGGGYEEGLLRLKEATALIDELGAREYVSRIYAHQLAALLYAGRFRDALDRADELGSLLETNEGDEATTAMTERVLAWLLLRAGRLEESEAFIADGLERGEQIDHRYEVGLLLHARAELHRVRGDEEVARADIVRASEMLSALGVAEIPDVPSPAS